MVDEPTIRMRANIPVNVAAKIELFLRDPIRSGKKRYGEFSKITTMLWQRYFEELESSSKPSGESDE